MIQAALLGARRHVIHVLQFVVFVSIQTPVLQAVPAQSGEQFRKNTDVVQSFRIPGVDATFDYVVVGGGTVGLAFLPARASSSYCLCIGEE